MLLLLQPNLNRRFVIRFSLFGQVLLCQEGSMQDNLRFCDAFVALDSILIHNALEITFSGSFME